MQFFIVVLLLCCIIFLFCLYYLGKEDYVLLRKNVNLDVLFNIAIGSLFVGLLFSRIFYVMIHPKLMYLNPLVFLAFPYYPGLSLGGGVIAGVLFIYLLADKKRYPFWRILDLIALSFLAAVPWGMLGSILLGTITVYSAVFMAILYFSFFLFFMTFLYPKFLKGVIKEGRIGMCFFLCFSIFSLLLSIVNHKKGLILFFGIEDLVAILIFIVSLIVLIRLEKQQGKNSK